MKAVRSLFPKCLCVFLIVSSACDRGQNPVFREGLTLGGQSYDADVLNQGALLYRRYCASCHGEKGEGDGPAGRSLPKAPFNFTKANYQDFPSSSSLNSLPTAAEIEQMIFEGKPESGMPAWKLSQPDLRALTAYLMSLSPRYRK